MSTQVTDYLAKLMLTLMLMLMLIEMEMVMVLVGRKKEVALLYQEHRYVKAVITVLYQAKGIVRIE